MRSSNLEKFNDLGYRLFRVTLNTIPPRPILKYWKRGARKRAEIPDPRHRHYRPCKTRDVSDFFPTRTRGSTRRLHHLARVNYGLNDANYASVLPGAGEKEKKKKKEEIVYRGKRARERERKKNAIKAPVIWVDRKPIWLVAKRRWKFHFSLSLSLCSLFPAAVHFAVFTRSKQGGGKKKREAKECTCMRNEARRIEGGTCGCARCEGVGTKKCEHTGGITLRAWNDGWNNWKACCCPRRETAVSRAN